jgi:ATP-dependent 26S proteasome regulatory subunit
MYGIDILIKYLLYLAKVQGSFKDVRAPTLTIESLQSLISLPLIRPDLFKKGILKKNFIPGVLLFGPPGTGKVTF